MGRHADSFVQPRVERLAPGIDRFHFIFGKELVEDIPDQLDSIQDVPAILFMRCMHDDLPSLDGPPPDPFRV